MLELLYASTLYVLVDADDSLDSIFASDMAIGYYTSQRAGIGINAGRIRAIGSKIRDGEVQHTGVIPFLKKFEATVRCCTRMELGEVQRRSTSDLAQGDSGHPRPQE